MSEDEQRTLGRLETKIDQLLERTGDQEQRIRRVESKLHWYSGVIAAFVGVFTFFGEKIRAAVFG